MEKVCNNEGATEYDNSTASPDSTMSLGQISDEAPDPPKRGLIIPSTANGFKFIENSPTGRTAKELDELFLPPTRAALEPLNGHTELSYDRFGELPIAGLACRLLRQIKT